MSLSVENKELLERAIARIPALMAADPSLRLSMPSVELFQRVVAQPSSIEIVLAALETYAERPAIGVRQHALVADAVTGKWTAQALPAFTTLSYRELHSRIEQLASGLRQAGVVAGELIALVGFSTLDHLVAELACHYLAVASVPLAKNVSARELEQILEQCQSATLFCCVERLAEVARALPACPSVRRLVALDVIEGDDGHRALIEEARAAAASAAELAIEVVTIGELEVLGARAGRIDPVVPAAGSDPLLSLVYTSGSTGAPKGAMFGERAWHARWSTLPFLELAELPMVSVVFLPQNHMGGRNALANSLKLGGLAYLTHQSDMSTLFEDIRLVRPTYIHLVPRLSELVYQHFQSETARRSVGAAPVSDELATAVTAEMRGSFLGDRMLLALTASAPTPPQVLAFVKRCFEIPVVNVFAGTEYGQLFIDGSINHQNVLELKLRDVPELGYLVTDEPHPRGELLVRTARGISSYFKNEAATRALIDAEGFLHTGDIFERRGGDEMVWIDRKNNVQKLAQGEFVNLWKLETALAAGSRAIAQVYIQGDAARSYLLAVVVPEASEVPSEATDDELKALLRKEIHRLAKEHVLAPFEIPRDFLVERTPFSRENGLLTSLGKPSRPKLKQTYGAQLERLYEELEERMAATPAALVGMTEEELRAAQAEDAGAPSTKLAERLRASFAAALGCGPDELELSRSFRELGGDSMAAAELRMRLHKEWGIKLPPQALLAPHAPIDAALAEAEAMVEAMARRRSDAGAASATPDDHLPSCEEIHGEEPVEIYARDLRLARFFPELAPADGLAGLAEPTPRHLLLTGATGFLGRFLCCALLEHAARVGGSVTCLVRAGSDAAAFHGLSSVYGVGSPLQERFLRLAAAHLHVVAGDLEAPLLGLPAARYAELAERIDTVVHAAAAVNHALSYAELFDPNVLGTAQILRLCTTGRLKRCNYISTNSVSLALLGNRELARESDDTRGLGDGWPLRSGPHASGYRVSKWAGEVLAQDLSEAYGAPVNVFRCNLILPPARHGQQIHADDFFTRLICSAVFTGLYPESLYERTAGAPPHLDGLPADFIAEAIAAIAMAGEDEAPGDEGRYAVYHVNNDRWDDGVSLDSVMQRLVRRGYPLTCIADHATWFQKLAHALGALDARSQAASSLPILEQWRAPLETSKRRRIDASRFRASVRALRPHGQDELPQLDDDYFDRCLDEMIALGLIPPPAPPELKRAASR